MAVGDQEDVGEGVEVLEIVAVQVAVAVSVAVAVVDGATTLGMTRSAVGGLLTCAYPPVPSWP